MPRSPDKGALHITMSDADLQVVHQAARDRGFKLTSDYVRALIEADLSAQGIEFRFSVDRGGYRERRSEEGE